MVSTCSSRVKMNRVWALPILLVVSSDLGKCFFPCPRSRLRIWSRETGLAVPSRVSWPTTLTQSESTAYSRDFSRFPRRCPHILYRQPPSGESRVYRVTQLRTDGVRCQEPTGTGPVYSPQGSCSSNGCCLFRFHHGQFFYASLFPHSLLICTK